jgi:hypothetical protein
MMDLADMTRHKLFATMFLASVLGACEGDGSPIIGEDELCPATLPAATNCALVGDIVPIRQVTHPGRGVEVDARLTTACGQPLPASYAECVSVEGGATAARAYTPGHTLLLVANPSSAEERAATIAWVQSFLDARPAEEQIAIFRWGPTVEQLADFSSTRGTLMFRLEEGLGQDGGAGDAQTAIAASRVFLDEVNGAAALELRTLVVVPPAGMSPMLTDVGPSVVFWGVREPSVVSADIDGFLAAGAVGFGTCGATEARLGGGRARESVPLMETLPEEEALACTPETVAAGERVYPRRVELIFTPDEWAVYDERVDGPSKRDFRVSVKIGDADPVPATAHLRGHGSLRCDRKSYAINLDGNDKRHILPGAATDEFLLNSMCWDGSYAHNFTAYPLLQKMGLFPPKFDLTEVVVHGETRGVYFMVEKTKDAFFEDNANPSGLLRRRHDGEGELPEIKWTAEGASDPLVAFQEMEGLAGQFSGEDLVRELRRRMDLSSYLRWIATTSLLKIGDTGDEVWMLATRRSGDLMHSFSYQAWDPEDMLRLECVWEQYAFYDPNGIAYCAEGTLENAVLPDPAVYGLYVDEMRYAMSRITPADFAAATEATEAKFAEFFQDPAIRAASLEIGSPETYDEAIGQVRHRLGVIRFRFRNWYDEMMNNVAKFDGLPGSRN